MKILCITDIHVPYHDVKAIGALRHYANNHLSEGDVLWIGGDGMDVHPLSRFDQDPQKFSFRQELLDYRDYIHNWYTFCLERGASVVISGGNHEARLRKYISSNAAQLGFLADKDGRLSVPGLLGLGVESYLGDRYLPALQIPYYDYQVPYRPHALLTLVHGVHYGVTAAKQNLQSYGTSGVSGHSHRQTMYVASPGGRELWRCKTTDTLLLPPVSVDLQRTLVWAEAGHFCDLGQVDYIKGGAANNADWQAGGLLLDVDSAGSDAIFEPFRWTGEKIVTWKG